MNRKRLEDTVRVFDKYAQQYFDKYSSYQPYIESYRKFAWMLGETGVVLDLACGPGNVCRHLLAYRPKLEIHGIDLSPEMVRLAQREFPNQHFSLGDARELNHVKDGFNAVIAAFILPYLSRQEVAKFLPKVRSKMEGGGVLYLSTMEGDYSASGYQNKNSEDRLYIYYHQAEVLLANLAQSGFCVVDMERKPFEQDGKVAATDLFIYAKAC